MSAESDVKAGEAYVQVTARDQAALKAIARFERRFRAMGEAVSAVGRRMMTVGAAAVTSLVAMTGLWANTASAAVDAANRAGTSVEAITGLGYAAEQTGSDMAGMESGLKFLNKTLGQAAAGSKTAKKALADVGLTVNDLAGMSADEQFKLIADRIAAMKNPARQTAAAMAMFGRGGVALLPLLKEGSAGIDALIARGEKVGAVLNGKDALAAEEFGDALNDLKKAVLSNVFAVGASLVPVLRDAVEWFIDVAVSVRKWINENRGLVVSAFKIAVAVVGAGAALFALGTTFSMIASVLGFIVPLFAFVKVAVLAIGAAFGFLLSPIGLALGAVAAIGAYLIYATGAGGQMLDWLVGKFQGLARDAGEAWQGIRDALASGDLGLAAKIAWGFLQMETAKAIKALWEVWYGFKNWFLNLFTDAWYGAVIVAANVMSKLETWWAKTTAIMGTFWNGFVSNTKSAWNSAIGWMTKQWIKLDGLINEGVDVEGEIAAIDRQTAEQNSAVETERQKRDAATEQRKNDRLSQIEKDKKDATSGAVSQADAAKAQRDAAHQAEIDKMQAEIDAGRQEYQSLLRTAADKRAGVDGLPKKSVKPSLAHVAEESAKRDPKAGAAKEGTFNALAAFGLMASSPMDRVAKATEATAEGVDELVRQGGFAFAESE